MYLFDINPNWRIKSTSKYITIIFLRAHYTLLDVQHTLIHIRVY